jgi:hypothetical protein
LKCKVIEAAVNEDEIIFFSERFEAKFKASSTRQQLSLPSQSFEARNS